MEDVSDSRLAGGWLKMQLALLHASEEERSLKGMSFEDYKRAFILEPPGEKMEPSLFVAQDFEDPSSVFPLLDQRQSGGGSGSMKLGFGSSAPTGREPAPSKSPKKSSARVSRFGESGDFGNKEDFEDHAWESWGGLTTRKIRQSPFFKQFAMENPSIFNDLFTPTEQVEPDLLDPEKGFKPPTIKYGLGIPGVAKCKKRGETDSRFKSAYETTKELESSGRIEAFREATAMKQRKESLAVPSTRSRSSSNWGSIKDKNVSHNLFGTPEPKPKSERRTRPRLTQNLLAVKDEIHEGRFNHELDNNVNYTIADFFGGSGNELAMQRALSFSVDGEHGLCSNRGSSGSSQEKFDAYPLEDSTPCSRAEMMGSFEDDGLIDGEGLIEAMEKRTNGSLDREIQTPKKSALKSPRKNTDSDEERPVFKEERRARFAGISSTSDTPTTE